MLKVENIHVIQFVIMMSMKSILIIMSIFFKGVSTVIQSDNNLFKKMVLISEIKIHSHLKGLK